MRLSISLAEQWVSFLLNMYLPFPGGRNGYGAKLCNIFSTKFTVETACKESKKSFKQVRKGRLTILFSR